MRPWTCRRPHFLTTFDSPASAITCARAVIGSMREIGVDLRIGLHTGECDIVGSELGAIFPIWPRNSINVAGSKRETVIVPSDTPIDGLTLTSNTVPGPTTSVDDRTSRTSVCHEGSFRTSAM